MEGLTVGPSDGHFLKSRRIRMKILRISTSRALFCFDLKRTNITYDDLVSQVGSSLSSDLLMSLWAVPTKGALQQPGAARRLGDLRNSPSAMWFNVGIAMS